MIKSNILEKYLNLINNIQSNSNLENLDKFYEQLNNHFESNGRVFLAGNGGSAAIATHASTDINKLERNDKYINSMSLNTNISEITAYSNDDSFDNVFTNIIKNFEPNSQDTLIVISSSGESSNMINLIDYCNEKDVTTFSINGFDGGEASIKAKYSIVFNSKKNYYGPVEDLHMMLFHIFAHVVKNDIEEIA